MLIIPFAALILIAGIMLVVKPETIFMLLRNNIEHPVIHVMAVMARLIIGALLISQSALSRFPLVIEVLGWVLIVAGIFLAVIGRKKFQKLLSWVLTKFTPFGRLAGIIAIAFGGFLGYAFL